MVLLISWYDMENRLCNARACMRLQTPGVLWRKAIKVLRQGYITRDFTLELVVDR